MAKLAIGLDTASDRWHACGPGVGLSIHAYIDPKKEPNTDVRRKYLCDEFDDFLGFIDTMNATGTNEIHVFCEEPLGNRNAKTTRTLALVGGALWQVATSYDLFWHWVNISHWKKEIIGNGNADKARIRQHIEDEFGQTWEGPHTADYYDAYALKVYGERELAKLAVAGAEASAS